MLINVTLADNTFIGRLLFDENDNLITNHQVPDIIRSEIVVAMHRDNIAFGATRLDGKIYKWREINLGDSTVDTVVGS